jgi:hypothetical protein
MLAVVAMTLPFSACMPALFMAWSAESKNLRSYSGEKRRTEVNVVVEDRKRTRSEGMGEEDVGSVNGVVENQKRARERERKGERKRERKRERERERERERKKTDGRNR